MLRIRRDDMVAVISGKDKGKRGKIIQILPAQSRAIVEGANLVKKARRKTRQDQQGGIVAIEAPIHMSNIMLVCKQCDKPVRFKTATLKDGSKIRECKKCGAAI
ncbi:MAG: 50S ribosomal protein L24 [Candidatus Omnitrophota bacterium]